MITDEFLEELLLIQKELPVIKKTESAGIYKYADYPNIWDKIHDILDSHKILVTHEIDNGAVWTYVVSQHGKRLSSIPFSPEGLSPQKLGGLITYYKRYNLCAILNIIIEGEDDDAAGAEKGRMKSKRKDGVNPLETDELAF